MYRGRKQGLYFLDEPTAEMDAETQVAILDALCAIRNQATILVVSHDPALLSIADQIIDLDKYVESI